MPEIPGVPRLPRDVVRRERLGDILDTDAPLVIVRGFAGVGKTVTVADWVRARPQPHRDVVWFTVDRSTSDRAVFWRELLERLADVASERLRPALEAARAELGHDAASPALRRRLGALAAALERPLLVVVDDLHLIRDRDVLHDLLAFLHGSPLPRLVALTRRETFVDVSLGGLLSVSVPSRRLLFTREELAAFVRTSGVLPDDGPLFETLWQGSGGVPLVARSMLTLSHEFIAEHGELPSPPQLEALAAVALTPFRDGGGGQRVDDDVRALSRLALADELSVDLAVALGGYADAAAASEALDDLASFGFGEWAEAPGGETLFRFDARTRAALQSQLTHVSAPEIASLKRLVLRWASDRGRAIEALAIAIELEDHAAANELVIRHHEVLLATQRRAVIAILDRLGRRTLAEEPFLALLLALCLDADPDHRGRAADVFAIARLGVRQSARRAQPVYRVFLHSTESIALRITGQFGEAVASADRALEALDVLSLDQKDSLDSSLPTMMPQLALAQATAGRRRRSRELFRTALALPRHHSELGHLHALSLCAGAAAVDGEIVEARRLVAIADAEQWPPQSATDFTGAFLQVARATLALEDGDPDGALEIVSAMGDYLLNGEFWPHFAQVAALAELGMGRPLQGAAALESVLEPGARPPMPKSTRQQLDATLATLFVAAGHPTRARAVLKAADAADESVRVAAARLHLSYGDGAAARAALRPLTPDHPRLRAEALLLTAAADLQLGEESLALDTFERAAVLLEQRGLRHPLMLLPEADLRALVALASASQRMARYSELLEAALRTRSVLPAPQGRVVVTERERIVLEHLQDHPGAAAIAQSLFVSVNTVKTQLRSLYRKLGASSRSEALARARTLGLLE